jgi:hypothetical protein
MRLAIITASTITLAACGKPVAEDQRTADPARQESGDATRQGEGGLEHEHASCLTFWLHEDHCAVGDETADDFANAGDDTPDSDGGGSAADDTPADDTVDADDDAVDTPDSDDSASTDPTPPPAGDPNVVEFRIAAGTGNQPWNTIGAPMNVKVGQTLRIINDDTINHRLHTGGQPCGHQPGNMAPGQSYDCVVARAYDGTAGGAPMYDHIVGPSARFYVVATP